jgi:hypothetical protein
MQFSLFRFFGRLFYILGIFPSYDIVKCKSSAFLKNFLAKSDFILQICGFGAKSGLHIFSLVIVRSSIF